MGLGRHRNESYFLSMTLEAVYRATFRAHGDADSQLLVVALGREPAEALEGLEVPKNCRCLKHLPQVELLTKVWSWRTVWSGLWGELLGG